ncbi:MAG: thioredoxin-like domain-containing protein [Luteolibacter sp.]
MKTLQFLLIASSFVSLASAEFRSWTNKDGKTVEMELVSVNLSSFGTMGEFKTRDGRKVNVAVSSFSEADAKILNEWKPPAAAPAPEVVAPSVFDKFLHGDLVALDGKSLKTVKDFVKPKKYYLFYYTASWCGPCQRFTPSLVEFYDANKPGNADFEIILVTSDRDEDAMEAYAATKKMKWPHLKFSKVSRFKQEFNHPGTGIPNLVLADTEGNLLKTSYVNGEYLGPTSVMKHLGTLLKK